MISPLLDALVDPKHVVLELRGGTAGEAVWEIVQLLHDSRGLREAKEFFEAVVDICLGRGAGSLSSRARADGEGPPLKSTPTSKGGGAIKTLGEVPRRAAPASG